MSINISDFASDPNLLNLKLWPKQSEILQEFFCGNHSLAVWALGRRSGKSLMAAIAGVYAATMLADEYRNHLRPGEKFYIISVANSDSQAKIAIQIARDLIINSPILKKLITRQTADSLELSNGAVFRALPASSRSGRGMACPVLIFDEIAHALDGEGNAAGDQLFQALSPSTAQFGSLGKILLLSSPWFQRGVFWNLHQQASSGQYPYMQAVNLPTWEVNPVISRDWLDQERSRDPQLFRVEYGAEFSGNVAAFLDSDLIDSAINHGRSALPPLPQFRGRYFLSLDPAKGGRDAYVACIVHADGDRVVIDKFHEFAPSWCDGKKKQVDISAVETWIQEHHKIYGFARVCLDQYNSQASIQRLRDKMPIQELTWTVQSKTQAFSKTRELFNSETIELYGQKKAIQQLKNLVVTYRANGAWNVSGGSGAGVDDYCSALAGAILMVPSKERQLRLPPSYVSYSNLTGRVTYSGQPVPESLSERFEREQNRLSPYEHWKRRQQQ